MKCVSIRSSGLVVAALAFAAVQACSSADDSEQDVGSLTANGGSSSTPVAAAGATSAPPASGGAPGSSGSAGTEGNPSLTPLAAGGNRNADSGATAGAGGATAGAGGTTTTGGAGGVPGQTPSADALCPAGDPSPSDGVTCTVTCTDPCGIKNLGTRVCTCAVAVFDCASCEFSEPHPLLEPPTEPLPDCAFSDDLQEDDETGCADNERCQSIGRTPGATDGANRFCGCLADSWDCDTQPASFGG